MGNLTEKQKKFIDYYILTNNASEAARMAGYSLRTAFRTGQENMQKPAIKAAIAEKLKQEEEKRTASVKELLEHLTSAARGEMEEENLVMQTMANGATKPMKVKTKIKAKDRLKAIEQLLRRFKPLLDEEEQKARIRKLVSEVEQDEKAGNGDDVVIIDDLGDDEENDDNNQAE